MACSFSLSTVMVLHGGVVFILQKFPCLRPKFCMVDLKPCLPYSNDFTERGCHSLHRQFYFTSPLKHNLNCCTLQLVLSLQHSLLWIHLSIIYYYQILTLLPSRWNWDTCVPELHLSHLELNWSIGQYCYTYYEMTDQFL